MQIGESVETRIFAKKIWNNTGIHLESQQIYLFEAAVDDKWSDAQITCNANGYVSPNALMRAVEWMRRAPRWKLVSSHGFN
jgi:hypothetical protein